MIGIQHKRPVRGQRERQQVDSVVHLACEAAVLVYRAGEESSVVTVFGELVMVNHVLHSLARSRASGHQLVENDL